MNADWEGITNVDQLKNTVVRTKFGEYIRNLKRKPKSLDAEVTRAREFLNIEVESNDATGQDQG